SGSRRVRCGASFAEDNVALAFDPAQCLLGAPRRREPIDRAIELLATRELSSFNVVDRLADLIDRLPRGVEKLILQVSDILRRRESFHLGHDSLELCVE